MMCFLWQGLVFPWEVSLCSLIQTTQRLSSRFALKQCFAVMSFGRTRSLWALKHSLPCVKGKCQPRAGYISLWIHLVYRKWNKTLVWFCKSPSVLCYHGGVVNATVFHFTGLKQSAVISVLCFTFIVHLLLSYGSSSAWLSVHHSPALISKGRTRDMLKRCTSAGLQIIWLLPKNCPPLIL